MNSPRFEVNPKIVAQHLERRAYVYVRQSSPHQVERNRESGRRQYGLVECAQQLGWPKDSICVIDEDQGRSGSTPHARLGFKDLVTAVGRSEVGIVLGLEISRLARNSPDWANLMYLCRFTDTLVGDETGVYDPTNPTDRMVLGLRGQVSEMELDTSIHRMVEARWSKARRGELLTMSPTGYEVDETGQLMKQWQQRFVPCLVSSTNFVAPGKCTCFSPSRTCCFQLDRRSFDLIPWSGSSPARIVFYTYFAILFMLALSYSVALR